MSKIILENVRKQFDSTVAVAGVSFEIPPGKAFGLLGPNGAGKTTLLRMMMDIIRPDSGLILYDGQPLTPESKNRITYLPEERGLYKKEKVRDLLEYFALLKGVPRRDARERVALYLKKLGMTDTAGRRIEELSKGNQQKIQIASTLISDPDLIILDEPFAGLDPLNVHDAKKLLSEERAKGKTVILSTHQMNQVEELCDNLMMISHGRQVLYGALENIVREYSEPAFLIECSPIEGAIPEIERVTAEGKAVKVYPAEGVQPTQLLRALIERGVRIERFQRATTPLEAIFVKVARQESAPDGQHREAVIHE